MPKQIQIGGLHLEKSHNVDARLISGHPMATPTQETFFMKKVRKNNRQLHMANT